MAVLGLVMALLVILPAGLHAEILRSDFDNSGQVDFEDFLLFVVEFGGSNPTYDLDDDGRVAFDDFLLFAADFGKISRREGLAWTEIVATTASPVGRLDHTMIFDHERGRLVVFGGKTTVELNDTWVFDGKQWRDVSK